MNPANPATSRLISELQNFGNLVAIDLPRGYATRPKEPLDALTHWETPKASTLRGCCHMNGDGNFGIS